MNITTSVLISSYNAFCTSIMPFMFQCSYDASLTDCRSDMVPQQQAASLSLRYLYGVILSSDLSSFNTRVQCND